MDICEYVKKGRTGQLKRDLQLNEALKTKAYPILTAQ